MKAPARPKITVTRPFPSPPADKPRMASKPPTKQQRLAALTQTKSCMITAAEINDWLGTLPVKPEGDE